ncbi:MAG: aminotransferase class V-fold PLP-dependent enzyme [Hyphomicrobiaceae bacterium]
MLASLASISSAISAHKLGGPRGVGALILAPDGDFAPLIAGGGQERRRRAGTENVAGIAGFAAAADAASLQMAEEQARIGGLRDRLEQLLLAATPQAVILGAHASRLANTTCVALPGRLADVLVAGLDLAGVAVSAGAACSSGKVTTSATLQAMGLEPEIAGGAIRVSIGPTTTETDISAFLAAWNRVAEARKAAA